MNRITIRIRQDLFNDEYHADVSIYNNTKCIAADDLVTLMFHVKMAVLELSKIPDMSGEK